MDLSIKQSNLVSLYQMTKCQLGVSKNARVVIPVKVSGIYNDNVENTHVYVCITTMISSCVYCVEFCIACCAESSVFPIIAIYPGCILYMSHVVW